MLGRAPLDLRVNALAADRATLALPVPGEPTLAPQGLRLPHGTQIEQWEAYQHGLIEVQDTGSQLGCLALAAQPGETVIDLCAGAGGKTLALAADMAGQGRLIAADTDRARLTQAGAARPPRRGGAHRNRGCSIRAAKPRRWPIWSGRPMPCWSMRPCSGTGTWRRNPEARWRLTAAQVERYAATQARLLDLAATLVKPGGRLVYVVCSLLDAEGADQAEGMLARHPGWSAQPNGISAGQPRGPGLRLTPQHDGTDGFFIARFGSP